MTANKKGATLIELVMLIIILAIIGVTVSGVVIFFAQLFMYSPRQLDTQKIGQELSDIMVEGNQDARGIRFTRSIIDASSQQFSYIYGYPTAQDGQGVRFRWNAADSHIYRSTSSDSGVTWSTQTVVPYYLLNNIATTIDGKDASGVIFTYKKAADADWVSGVDALSTIRRVIIGVKVQTGSGAFSGFQGSSNITSSVEIKGF